MRALQHPRWEDYEYSRKDEVPNRLYWLGDGQTYNEKTMTGDRTCNSSAILALRSDAHESVVASRRLVPSEGVLGYTAR